MKVIQIRWNCSFWKRWKTLILSPSWNLFK